MHDATPNSEGQAPRVPNLDSEIDKLLGDHPGLTREQLLAHLQREESFDAAARAPFPGPLRAAFAGGPRTVTLRVIGSPSPPRSGGEGWGEVAQREHGEITYTLQPVSLALISALERIESPFIPMVEIIGANSGKSSDEIARLIEQKLHPTTEQLIATVYCIVTEIDIVEAELDKGAEHFHKLARKVIGRAHHPADLGRLNEAILLHYVASFSTVVDYRAKRIEGDQSFPSAPAEQAMVSAGASTSAAS
jgi:hypothetical protein